MTADDILAKARERLAEIDAEILKLAAEKLQLQRMLSPAPVAPVLPALPPILPTEPGLPTGPFWEIPRPLPYERHRVLPNTGDRWQDIALPYTICTSAGQSSDAATWRYGDPPVTLATGTLTIHATSSLDLAALETPLARGVRLATS